RAAADLRGVVAAQPVRQDQVQTPRGTSARGPDAGCPRITGRSAAPADPNGGSPDDRAKRRAPLPATPDRSRPLAADRPACAAPARPLPELGGRARKTG